MRIVFMGTPEFAVPALDALVAAGHELVAAYTQPPRPAGRRGRAPTPSPVQSRAESLGIPVRSPILLKSPEEQAAFAALAADVAVVAAYGLILPRAILDAPSHGCLNIHGSLLPRWRGAAPIQRAILAGDAETGVGIMQMEAGLDTGPVRLEGRTSIARKTAGELTAELAQMGARLMVETLADLDRYPPQPQPADGITYAAKIDKAELRLDFTLAAEQVERQVRAFNPPGAWFDIAEERIRILAALALPGEGRGPVAAQQSGELSPPNPIVPRLGPGLRRGGMELSGQLDIQCGEGLLRPTLVQRAGRAVMTVDELLRGFPIAAGTQL